MQNIKEKIRNIPDFPKPGIQFKDITPLLANPEAFKETIDAFRQLHEHDRIDIVAGIEARGFVFAAALAYAIGAGTCLIRKPGKLPHSIHRQTYELEYGNDAVEIHTDAFKPGQRILIIDDVLATGGTISAAIKLIRNNFDVEIAGVDFLMELTFLNGRQNLPDLPIRSLIQF